MPLWRTETCVSCRVYYYGKGKTLSGKRATNRIPLQMTWGRICIPDTGCLSSGDKQHSIQFHRANYVQAATFVAIRSIIFEYAAQPPTRMRDHYQLHTIFRPESPLSQVRVSNNLIWHLPTGMDGGYCGEPEPRHLSVCGARCGP